MSTLAFRVSDSGPAVPDQAVACTLPLYSSVEDQAPDRLISLAELAAMASAPTLGPKLEAAAVTPYSATGKKKEHALQSLYHLLVIDHDHDNQDAAGIESIYDSFGVAFLAYTTSSHQRPDKQDVIGNRWRVLVPLAAPIDAAQYNRLACGIAYALGADQAQARAQQVFFAPNRVDVDQPYQHTDRLSRPHLDADDYSHPLIDEALAGWQSLQRAKEEKAQAAQVRTRPVLSADKVGIIDKALTAYSIRDLLEANGYKRQGADYLSPTSSSGNAGVHILERDGKEVCYSHHGDSDPLSAMNNNGHALDAFDVLVALEYRGDFTLAIRTEAKKLDQEGQKQRQREHMQAKAEQQPSQAEGEPARPRFKLLDGFDLAANAKAPVYLIDEILEEDAHGIMGGASMTYKTFIALRMAYSVCTGEPFMGRRVYRQGKVLFIAGEGASGLSRRWKALQLKLGAVPAGQFFMYGEGVTLKDPIAMQRLTECIEDLKPTLVIFDTFAALSGGVDENSPSEVGGALSHVRRACQAGGASSLIVHHFGKDETKGFRGASSFTNDVDFAFMVNRPGSNPNDRNACMVCHKMKDGDQFKPLHFKATAVPLGLLDQKGQEVYSLVAEQSEEQAKGADIESILENGTHPQRALEALRICWNTQRDRLELAGVTGKNPSVTWGDWINAANSLGVKNLSQQKNRLDGKGLIECLSNNEYRPKT